MTSAIVVGFVGLAGAGKSEATAIAARNGAFSVVYFGGVVLAEVKKQGLPEGSESERAVREALRLQEGMDVMARRSLPTILEFISRGSSVLIDGIYSYAELKLLRSALGSMLSVVAIHASRATRAARLATRTTRPLSVEEMNARDQAEVEMLEKSQPIALADFHIVNDGTAAELEADVYRVLARAFGI